MHTFTYKLCATLDACMQHITGCHISIQKSKNKISFGHHHILPKKINLTLN